MRGIPEVVKSDNGPAFKSTEFAAFARRMGFKHHKVTPLNPEANGMCERFMRPINKAIRCAVVEKKPWKNVVAKMLRNYKATPHSSTGVSPNIYMGGKDEFDKIPTLNKEADGMDMFEFAKRNDDKAKANSKRNADKFQHAKSPHFRLKDKVLHKWDRSHKHAPLFDPFPYEIKEIKGNMVSVARDGHGLTRNSRFFKWINDRCYQNAMEMRDRTKSTKLAEVASVLSTEKRQNHVVENPIREDLSDDEHEEGADWEYSLVAPAEIEEATTAGRPSRTRKTVVHFDANKQVNASRPKKASKGTAL